jgi:uncharacterized protein (TIGR01777 family)
MRGHEVVVLTRSGAAPQGRAVAWNPASPALGDWAAEIDGASAVVNLTGASIAGARWTAARKRELLGSRLEPTRRLADAIHHASHKPDVLVSMSAVGYYGARGSEPVAEDGGPGSDFLADLCVRWEAEAQRVEPPTRVVRLRTAPVLERGGGMLAPMLLPFKLGVGGPSGSGHQYWPWIHRRDWVELAHWAIVTPGAEGALNASAPHPVTSREFARALGRALGRPAWLPTPAFALRLLFGELADVALLSGQRAVPAAAERLGFSFRYPRLDQALGAIFGS